MHPLIKEISLYHMRVVLYDIHRGTHAITQVIICCIIISMLGLLLLTISIELSQEHHRTQNDSF